jgi:hypothetical protein
LAYHHLSRLTLYQKQNRSQFKPASSVISREARYLTAGGNCEIRP